jgi:hypothetical protein
MDDEGLWVVTVPMSGTVQLQVKGRDAEEALKNAQTGRWTVYLPKTTRDWSGATVEPLTEDVGI